MQTFLPDPSFERSARVLDPRRLGKQWVEAFQCLRALHVPGYGWRHHRAVRMWRGHGEALAAYGVAVCGVWTRAGHADTVAGIAAELGRQPRRQPGLRGLGLLPRWLGRRAFHRAHRSALVARNPAWYHRFFPDVPDDLPYVWPDP